MTRGAAPDFQSLQTTDWETTDNKPNRMLKGVEWAPFDAAQGRLRDGREKMRPPQGERKTLLKSPPEPFGLRRPRLLIKEAVSKPSSISRLARLDSGLLSVGLLSVVRQV